MLLPIGISFFTFHAISYVVDVYRREAIAQKSPVHAALYLLLFPQLIAGPIIRYTEIADQLARRVVSLDDFANGVRRFIIGLGKKVLIANIVAGPADRIFSDADRRSSTPPTPGSASSATRCRSTSISPATPTWRSASAGCSASGFPRTSAGPTSPTPCRNSGGAGTCRCRPGSATTSTCRSAATASSPCADVSQPGHRLLPVRPVARRQLELRHLGLFHGTFLVVERLGLASAIKRLPRRRCVTPICCSS